MEVVTIQGNLMAMLLRPKVSDILPIYCCVAVVYASYFTFVVPTFMLALAGSMGIVLIQSLFSLWVTISAKAPVLTMADVAPVLPFYVIQIPVMEEVIFRFFLPQHIGWIASPSVTAVICSIAFGGWHITSLRTFRIMYKGLPPLYTLILLAAQILCTAVLGFVIATVGDFVAGVILHMCYNLTGFVLSILGRQLYAKWTETKLTTTHSAQVRITKRAEISADAGTSNRVTQSKLAPPTPAELKELFISSVPNIHTRRLSEPSIDSSKLARSTKAKRKDASTAYLSKREAPEKWTTWRELEMQLALQQHRREQRMWGSILSLSKELTTNTLPSSAQVQPVPSGELLTIEPITSAEIDEDAKQKQH